MWILVENNPDLRKSWLKMFSHLRHVVLLGKGWRPSAAEEGVGAMGKQPWGREEMSARNEAIEAARASPARRVMGAVTGGIGMGLIFGSVAGAIYGALSRNRLRALHVAPTWAGWCGLACGAINGYKSATRRPEETEAVLARLQAMEPGTLGSMEGTKARNTPEDLRQQLDALRRSENDTGISLAAEKRAIKRKLKFKLENS